MEYEIKNIDPDDGSLQVVTVTAELWIDTDKGLFEAYLMAAQNIGVTKEFPDEEYYDAILAHPRLVGLRIGKKEFEEKFIAAGLEEGKE